MSGPSPFVRGLAAAALAVAFSACDAGGPEAPTGPDSLVGTWGSVAVEETLDVTSPMSQTLVDFGTAVPTDLSVSGLGSPPVSASADNTGQGLTLLFQTEPWASIEVSLYLYDGESGRSASLTTFTDDAFATYHAAPDVPILLRDGATVEVPSLTLDPGEGGATGPATVSGRVAFQSADLDAGVATSVLRTRREIAGVRGARALLYAFAADGTYRKQTAGDDGRGPVVTTTRTWELDGDRVRLVQDQEGGFTLSYRVRLGSGQLYLGEPRLTCDSAQCLSYVAPQIGLGTAPTAYAEWTSTVFARDA